MRFYGQAEQAADKIIAAFESGQVPAALASVFIHKHDDAPCNKWSWQNQLIVALSGHLFDARGFRQWQSVGRSVNKGEKAIHILAPMIGKSEDKETGEKVSHVYGFKSVAVFGLDQTSGESLESKDSELYSWLEQLPLRQVAEHWNLTISAFSGEGARYAGYYRHRKAIAVGVKNLSTWAHELCHSSDDRIQGGLAGSSKIDKEIIAELGGSILLEILGYKVESDRGGCWRYIKHYADDAKIQPLSAITKVLNRTCQAVALILETAEQLQAGQAA